MFLTQKGQDLQAENENTTERPSASAIATRSVELRVSSRYIRQEAARSAAAAKFAETVENRFAILRTRILREMRKNGWRRLAVVPLTRGAGGTFVAVQLALAMVRQRYNEVILVDLDLGRPSVATELGIPGGDTFAEMIEQGLQIVDIAAIVEEAPNLWVVAPIEGIADAAETLQDSALLAAMEQWRSLRPEGIEIVDTAALIGDAAALAALPMADAILLVADGRRSTHSDILQAERLLKDMPPVMGVILNKSED